MSASPIARIVLRMLVDGRLPDAFARYAHRRALTNEDWARTYHELRTAERALESADDGARPPLSSSQHAFVRARVLAAARAQRPVVAHAPVPWLAGAAAAASLAFFVWSAPRRDADGATDDDGWRARSAHGAVDAKRANIRVHCVDKARTQVLDEADLAPEGADELRCPAGGLLAFSATNRTDKQRWPAIVARDGEVVAFTVPFEGEDAGSAVPPGSVALRLARGAPLDDDGRARTLVLRGAMFDEPVPAARVARALDDEAPSLRVTVFVP
jgi:hypothetical protein